MDIFKDVVEEYSKIGLNIGVESVKGQACYRLKVDNDKEMIIPFEFLLEERYREIIVSDIILFFKRIITEKKKTP